MMPIYSNIEHTNVVEVSDRYERFELAPLLKESVYCTGRLLPPRERMLATLQSIWGLNESVEREWMIRLLKILFKDVELTNWAPSKRENEYRVELKNEFIGTLPYLFGCKVVLKPTIVVQFKEEKSAGTDRLQKVIDFPEGGLVGRIGFGWLSKDFPIEKIVITHLPDEKTPHFIIVHPFGEKKKEAQRALEIWEAVKWQSS